VQIVEATTKLTQISAYSKSINLIATGTTKNKSNSIKTETSQFAQL